MVYIPSNYPPPALPMADGFPKCKVPPAPRLRPQMVAGWTVLWVCFQMVAPPAKKCAYDCICLCVYGMCTVYVHVSGILDHRSSTYLWCILYYTYIIYIYTCIMYPICYIYMHKHVYIIIRSKVVVLLFYLGSQKHAGVANQSLENSPQNTGYALNKNIDGRMNHHGTPPLYGKIPKCQTWCLEACKIIGYISIIVISLDVGLSSVVLLVFQDEPLTVLGTFSGWELSQSTNVYCTVPDAQTAVWF